MPDFIEEERYPALHGLVAAQLRVWPDHERFLRKRFATGHLASLEETARLVTLLSESQETLAEDYAWWCERVYEEELHFRRTGRYRLTRLADAIREVYSNYDYMRRYMNGVLLTHV